MSQQIGKGIVEKIQELVGEGVRNIREMEGAINVFVKNDIFQGESLPPRTSGHFFPERRNLQNHMCRASVKLRFSKIDQENLSMKVDIWRKEKAKDTFFFGPYGNDQHLPCPEQLFFNENGNKISDVSFRYSNLGVSYRILTEINTELNQNL